MNPYDRGAVRRVWARVRPGQDVFAPGPPAAGPRPPVFPPPPSSRPPGQGGKPPGNGPNPPPPPPEAQMAADRLDALAAGYDLLARRLRAPWLRRLAAQCRRSVSALQDCAGVRAQGIPDTRVTADSQRGAEAALRELLEQLDGPCRAAADRLLRESRDRSRRIARLR